MAGNPRVLIVAAIIQGLWHAHSQGADEAKYIAQLFEMGAKDWESEEIQMEHVEELMVYALDIPDDMRFSLYNFFDTFGDLMKVYAQLVRKAR